MDYPYLIRYISDETLNTCFDSETAANQITACKRFKARKPNARCIEIKSRSGIWISHFLKGN